MATVRITEKCLKCLRRLIETSVNSACASEDRRKEAFARAWNIVFELKDADLSPAHVANRFHPLIRQICKSDDPFSSQKKREMGIALELSYRYRPSPNASLRDLLLFALRGNAIDFFRPIEELEHWFNTPLSLGRDETNMLERLLDSRSKLIVWLSDNAGEIFFDLPAARKLKTEGHEVYYCVKEGPVQNDATITDIEPFLSEFAPVRVMSTGAETVGLELEKSSPRFQDIYRRAHVVIAKGMGHFETLYGSGDKRIFYMFMAKCEPVAEVAGIKLNQFMAGFERT